MENILKCFCIALPHLDIACCSTPLHNWLSEKGEAENTSVNKTWKGDKSQGK